MAGLINSPTGAIFLNDAQPSIVNEIFENELEKVIIKDDKKAGNSDPLESTQLKEFSVKCLYTIEELKKICLEHGIKGNFELDTAEIKASKKRRTSLRPRKSKRTSESQPECVYEVEDIVDYKITDKLYFFVKWQGWDSSSNTWEPLENLLNCDDVLEEFKERNYMNVTYDHPFKRLIQLQLLIEKITAESYTDPAILLKMCDIPLSSFNNRKSELSTMKKIIREKSKIVGEYVKEDVETAEISYTMVLNYVLWSLNVFKHFKDLSEVNDFVEQRRKLLPRLKRWEASINNQIKEEINGIPIAIENNVDLEGPPENFTYITSSRFDASVIFVDEDPPVWCECNDCHENKTKCCPGTMEAQFAYTKKGKLRLPPQSPIYECNKKCKCSSDCPNRVIQKGRQHKVAMFRTDNGCGWGVKALEPIPKNRFVMEYVGEIITVEEADRRENDYDQQGRIYLFDLDFTEDGESSYTIDAAHYGDISHFVNHSCDPNLEVYVAWINNYNMRLSQIAFFSRRDIKAGEQLTFDYKLGLPHRHNEPVKENSFDEGKTSEHLPKEDGRKVIVEPINPLLSVSASRPSPSTSKSENIADCLPQSDINCPTLTNGGLNSEDIDEQHHLMTKDNITLVSGRNSPPAPILEPLPAQVEDNTLSSPTQPPIPLNSKSSSSESIDRSKSILCKCGAKNCRIYLY